MGDRELKKNAEGYPDPTAYEAICNVEAENLRFRRTLRAIYNVVELAGFEVDGPIVLVDKRSGHVWR